jgi:prevent-host-death family protein
MIKQCSVAEAQRDLAALVDLATAGAEIVLTQRGRLVGVLVSIERYAELKVRPGSFSEVYSKFRARFPRGAPGTGLREVRSLRPRDGGREVNL